MLNSFCSSCPPVPFVQRCVGLCTRRDAVLSACERREGVLSLTCSSHYKTLQWMSTPHRANMPSGWCHTHTHTHLNSHVHNKFSKVTNTHWAGGRPQNYSFRNVKDTQKHQEKEHEAEETLQTRRHLPRCITDVLINSRHSADNATALMKLFKPSCKMENERTDSAG